MSFAGGFLFACLLSALNAKDAAKATDFDMIPPKNTLRLPHGPSGGTERCETIPFASCGISIVPNFQSV